MESGICRKLKSLSGREHAIGFNAVDTLQHSQAAQYVGGCLDCRHCWYSGSVVYCSHCQYSHYGGRQYCSSDCQYSQYFGRMCNTRDTPEYARCRVPVCWEDLLLTSTAVLDEYARHEVKYEVRHHFWQYCTKKMRCDFKFQIRLHVQQCNNTAQSRRRESSQSTSTTYYRRAMIRFSLRAGDRRHPAPYFFYYCSINKDHTLQSSAVFASTFDNRHPVRRAPTARTRTSEENPPVHVLHRPRRSV